ncbi:hypothetical protein FQN55_005950 [Onygenales sp. PD_40]|nr:hypothetical protein FQN55_005950 [Onygenales sp. PD_40]
MISYSLPWSRETPSHESTTFKDHFKQNAISLIFRNQLLILKIQTFEDHFKETEFSVADLQNKLKSAEHCISDVEGSVADLKDVRNRFISTYKRDVLGIETEADKVMIRRGNRFVHGGDCKRDADLYEAPAQRRDFKVYMKLYGLQPGNVRSSICGCWAMVIIELPHNLSTMLQIMARLHCLGQLREVFVWALTVNHSFHWYWAGNFTKKVISNLDIEGADELGGGPKFKAYRPAIELLDRHAAAVADKKIELPIKFNDLFVNFIQALEASDFDEDYLANPRSSVTVAYWAFLQSCPE